MYFSLEPKVKREDLYDREEELKELEDALSNNRIILITGIRRIGKTSLLRVFLEEKKKESNPFVFIDCRSFTKGNIINKNALVRIHVKPSSGELKYLWLRLDKPDFARRNNDVEQLIELARKKAAVEPSP